MGIMLRLSTTLQHYKRKEVQEALLAHAQHKEIAVKFGEKGFGKRPDTLQYENDVLELAKQGATSFHASEELWSNPLRLDTEMRKQEQEELRIGWDLVLDVDAHHLEYSKIAAHLIVEALRVHDLQSISVKFSGNRGFHIGVPFEAFHPMVSGKATQLLFPEGPRRIADYLQYLIREKLTKNLLETFDIHMLVKQSGKPFHELVLEGKLDPFVLVSIDTLLISPRHLYRMPYCLHEKSGLVSVPLSPKDILSFEKARARPENLSIDSKLSFLERNTKPQEAKSLLVEAFDYSTRHEQQAWEEEQEKQFHAFAEKELEAVPEQFFPPCIQIGLNGLTDGRKRFVFILINFLHSLGWSYEEMEKKLYEWNKKNPEPLREITIRSQLQYHKQRAKRILPPNCQNLSYYVDIGICKPDNLCRSIKNPVSYSRRKTKYLGQEQKQPRARSSSASPPQPL